MWELGIEGSFDAAHHLPGYPGACAKVHGHRFKVKVMFRKKKLNNMGMVIDFQEIKSTWKKYDHQDLNDFFEMPTAENIAYAIWDDIVDIAKTVKDIEVTVWESENSYAKYY